MDIITNTTPIRLDLGCGQVCKEGFEGVDKFATHAPHKMDLLVMPWKWADNSVEEIYCSHFVEHIPMIYTEDGRDLAVAFFDECWRILKPGAKMTVITPSSRSDRAFQDWTHRRFIPETAYLYLSKEWRELNKLDHYYGKCNFGVNVVQSIPQELSLRCPEVQGNQIREKWNTTIDFVATLIKI